MRQSFLFMVALAVLLGACSPESVAPAEKATPDTSSQTPPISASEPEAAPSEVESGPYRIGDRVKAPVVKKRVEPEYVPVGPGVAVSGVILIEAVVTKEGKVRDVKILKDPNEENAKRLAEAVKQWEFEPGTLDGEPVDVIFNISSYIHYR